MQQPPTPFPSLPRPAPRIYLVNVGVNTAHRLKSPVYPDGRFEFVPIPEDATAQGGGNGYIQPIRYRDLYCYHSPEPLLSLFPQPLHDAYVNCAVHYDPHLGNGHDGASADFSYGDTPWVNLRASALQQARVGDWLLFLSNLADYDPDRHWFVGQRAFYLIGMIEVGQVLEYDPAKEALEDRDSGLLSLMITRAENAHVNRLVRLPGRYHDQPFSIFQGSPRSLRFPFAVPVTPDLCCACFTDKDGQPFDVDRFPTFVACVASYTRAIRAQFSLDVDADRRRYYALRERTAHLVTLPDL